MKKRVTLKDLVHHVYMQDLENGDLIFWYCGKVALRCRKKCCADASYIYLYSDGTWAVVECLDNPPRDNEHPVKTFPVIQGDLVFDPEALTLVRRLELLPDVLRSNYKDGDGPGE